MKVIDIKTSSAVNINSSDYTTHKSTTILAHYTEIISDKDAKCFSAIEEEHGKEIYLCVSDRLCYGILGNLKYKETLGNNNAMYISVLELFRNFNFGTTLAHLKSFLNLKPRTKEESDLILKYANIANFKQETERNKEKIRVRMLEICKDDIRVIIELLSMLNDIDMPFLKSQMSLTLKLLIQKKRMNTNGIPFNCNEIDTFLTHESLREDTMVSLDRIQNMNCLKDLRAKVQMCSNGTQGILRSNYSLWNEQSVAIGLKDSFGLSKIRKMGNLVHNLACYQIEIPNIGADEFKRLISKDSYMKTVGTFYKLGVGKYFVIFGSVFKIDRNLNKSIYLHYCEKEGELEIRGESFPPFFKNSMSGRKLSDFIYSYGKGNRVFHWKDLKKSILLASRSQSLARFLTSLKNELIAFRDVSEDEDTSKVQVFVPHGTEAEGIDKTELNRLGGTIKYLPYRQTMKQGGKTYAHIGK